MEFIFANLPNIIKDEEVRGTDRHRALDQLGRPPRAAARGRQAQLGPRLWPGDDAWEGSALLMWSGFDLRPRNLFDRTPFYPYPNTPPANQARVRGDGAAGEDGGRAGETASDPAPTDTPADPRRK